MLVETVLSVRTCDFPTPVDRV